MADAINELPMTPDEARDFLESNNYCLTHFVPMVGTGRKAVCEACVAQKQRLIETRARIAINVLRGEAGPERSLLRDVGWRKCAPGSLPKSSQRVEVIAYGFVETHGRAGGKERWTIGSNPIAWREI